METSARAIIVYDDLLLVEWYAPRKLCFPPGGRQESGESAVQTLQRELVEELGTEDFAIGRYCGTIHSQWSDEGRHFDVLSYFFEVTLLRNGAALPLIKPEEGREFRWIPLTGLESAGLKPMILRSLIPELQRKASKLWSFTAKE